MKNLLLNCSLIVFLFVSCKKLTVGESYKGGKIAYIDASGKHGLIAAPSDQEATEWGCYGTLISGADATAIGTGSQNTIDIMNGCSTAGIAARKCGDLVLGGFSDWHLPSKDELNQLYVNRVAIGGFSNDVPYWSSTEFNIDRVWYQFFLDGVQSNLYGGKDDYAYVRAVRSF